MAEERVQRRLAAILAADVAGYSRLMGQDEAATRARFNEQFDTIVTPAIDQHRGRLVKTMGDGFLVEFASVVEAVQCAADIQSNFMTQEQSIPKDRQMLLRMGVHLGDVIVEGNDIHGDGVNIAARLEEMAEPGSVCISDMVRVGVGNRVSLELTDLGDQSLKNIAEPVRVYCVELGEQAASGSAASDSLFRRPAVAVLPFENLSGDPDQDFFADGLTEDIITTLSLSRLFPVIARNSTFAYKGKSPDIRKVGEELGARYVIEGSVRKAGNRVRVTAQLINSETGHHVWAERYDRDLDDVFGLQDELTQRIAGTAAPELDRLEQKIAQLKSTKNLSAWEHVQRGIARLSERTSEGNIKAREEFDQALELDPTYSRAYSGLSWSYHRDTQISPREPIDEVLKNALETARKAIALDPSDPLAHVMLGIVLTRSADYEEAIAAYEHAINLNPSDANAYVSMGMALALAGSPEEGIAAFEKGFQLSPQEPRNHLYFAYMARAQLTGHHYSEAVEWAKRSIRWRPDTVEPHLVLASALGHLDQLDEAGQAIRECTKLDPTFMAAPEHWFRYKHQADSDHFFDGLRKAGWEG